MTTNDPDTHADEMVLPLRKPIPFGGGEPVSELRLREPTSGELKQVERLSGWSLSIALVSKVSGLLESQVEKIGQRDMEKAVTYLMGFSKPGPKPGD